MFSPRIPFFDDTLLVILPLASYEYTILVPSSNVSIHGRLLAL